MMFGQRKKQPFLAAMAILLLLPAVSQAESVKIGRRARSALARIGARKGICAVLGLPKKNQPEFVIDLAKGSELLVYFQSPVRNEVSSVRSAAENAGLLGKQVFAGHGGWESVHLADNLVGAIWVSSSALGREGGVKREELLRVLHPDGRAILSRFWSRKKLVKAHPDGTDSWSHPYHGPDNNPQSADKIAKAPYLTQFLGYPLFGCISEVTVASHGKMFKAFGHIAFKTAQNEVLNKLYAINGYNGTILWKRPLKKGFMIHRSTMVASPDTLYLADDESCKLVDTETGITEDEIVPPIEMTEGTVWKWMALENGILYALIGGEEIATEKRQAKAHGFGHWPWGMWKGYDYKDAAKAFGFGRNFVAIDTRTKKVLWHHREEDYLDSRGLCMKEGRIYYYSPEKFLACLNAADGKPIWKSSEPELLAGIGPHHKAQHYVRGFSTSAYMKCNGKYLFFAGPQRPNLVAVSCEDGKVAWLKEGGNFQLVLRDDALYAIGSQRAVSFKYQYDTGEVIEQFAGRRACTRATGTSDSIFFRASGGTIRYVPKTNAVEHIAPMRPPCHDGVIISDGMLYWGPWICGCNLSLYGNIALAPAPKSDPQAPTTGNLQSVQGDLLKVVELQGEVKQTGKTTTCGDMIFEVSTDGIVKASSAEAKTQIWKATTGGGINYAPAIWEGRVYVGSNDGWVYAFEAATGRQLWRYHAGPRERRIPVYGKLMSTWPVAGGVVVRDGLVYAAAGIAHYDGTHVFALDAITGKVKWHNNRSGSLSESKNGISLQGQLRINSDKLTFGGGNAYPVAEFDLVTGKCLTVGHGPKGLKPTTFYAVDSYLNSVRKRRGLPPVKKTEKK